MAHGGGGRLMHDLIERVFLSAFHNAPINARHDSAVVEAAGRRLAFTTDSYVVHPLFFPGGDIGSLAVHGTVNDLAMAGARPLFLSTGFILEEGLPVDMLLRIVRSMADAAAECGVLIVTGDTKVIDRRGDARAAVAGMESVDSEDAAAAPGLFINTAGVGVIEHDLNIAPRSVVPGDAVLLSGDVGRHGIAVMAVREGLQFEGPIETDSAPLAELVAGLIEGGIHVHCLRDLTRGGLATALNEIAETAGCAMAIDERAVPVGDVVRGACEILGLDPLYVACEGRMAAFVPEDEADRALEILRSRPQGTGAARIGRVVGGPAGRVTLRSAIGAERILDMLSGEQLPRIC